MQTIVKVTWTETDDGWCAQLRFINADGFRTIPLDPGTELAVEITDNRRCTGYTKAPGDRRLCPFERTISSGSQCQQCRNNDYYAGYVSGQSGLNTNDDFSVYLVQAGEAVKVGVTKSRRLEQRWVEQGADYAVELYGALSSRQALRLEDKISEEGINQRIRKEAKTAPATCRLDEIMDRHGFAGEITAVQDLTVYPPLSDPSLTRTGRFAGTIRSVKGQIVANDRIGLIMSSGRVMDRPSQKGLTEF